MNCIHLHAIPRRIPLFFLLNKALVKITIGCLVKASRKTEVGQLEMAVLVDQDVVGFDVTDTT